MIKERLTRRFTILTDQEIAEIKNELARCDLMKKICDLVSKLPEVKHEEAKEDLALLLKESRMPIVADNAQENDEAIKRLRKLTSGINVTEEEKQMILKTVGLKKGHWYKCPNGKYRFASSLSVYILKLNTDQTFDALVPISVISARFAM